MKTVIFYLTKKTKEKKLHEIGFRIKTKISKRRAKYYLKHSLKPLDFIHKNIEVLEDIIGEDIYFVERRKRHLRDDLIILHTVDFKVQKNLNIRDIPKDTVFMGQLYSGEMNLPKYNETSSLLVIGQTGSGKTTTIKTIEKYNKEMIMRHYVNLNISKKYVRIIIDPKGDDFKDLIGEEDYFFRLDEIEEYEELLGLLKRIDIDCKKANRANKETQIKYVLILDELLETFTAKKNKDKEKQIIIDEIVEKIEIILTQHSRRQKLLVIAGTQSFSVQESSINLNRFTDKLVSKPPHASFTNTLGSKKILDKRLEKGRFVSLKRDETIQMVESLNIEEEKKKIKEVSKVKLKKDILIKEYKAYEYYMLNENREYRIKENELIYGLWPKSDKLIKTFKTNGKDEEEYAQSYRFKLKNDIRKRFLRELNIKR